jgi:hypothetical protein
MALRRRRNGNAGSIDSARTSSYAATQGIRRVDSPTNKSGVFTIKNFDIDDDRALVLRDPILLYKNIPGTVTGTFYKVVYSFDGNRENDLYITSAGIFSKTGTLLPVIYKDFYGKVVTLTINPLLTTTYNYKINPEVTYVGFSTSNIINNFEVKLPDGSIGSRFVKHTILNNAPVLEILEPTEVNLNRTAEGQGIIFNPNFYNDVFQDIRDNYASQTFDVLGIIQYVLYDHTNKKLITPQLNNLTIETLLRSKEAIRYTIASSVPEGTGIYLKAFVNIKKYPKTKIYCAWEETTDGVFYNTCPEFKNKFANYLVNLKIRKDEVDVTSELKTISVTPFELFSDSDNVLNRPDVLFVKSDNKTRRFVLYALPSYEIIEGKQDSTIFNSLYTNPIAANRSADNALNVNDSRPYSWSMHIQPTDLTKNLKISLDALAGKNIDKAANDNVRKIKTKLQEISVLQKNATTNYLLNHYKWFVRAEVEYAYARPDLGLNAPLNRFEYLQNSSNNKLLTLDLESLTVEFASVPHKIKNIYLTTIVEKPNAVYPWSLKTKTAGNEILPATEPPKLNNNTLGDNSVIGDFLELNPNLDVIKEQQYGIYGNGFNSNLTNKKQEYINASLSSFTLSNLNEIDNNAINCNLEVDGFNITSNNTNNVYEIVSSPVVTPHIQDEFPSGTYWSALHSLEDNSSTAGSVVFAKPNKILINKSRLNTITIPKQEVNVSPIYNSNVYSEVMDGSGLTLKNINYLFTKKYIDWLTIFGEDNQIELRNSKHFDFGTGIFTKYLLLTKGNSTASRKLVIDTVLKLKEPQTSFQANTSLTIERPKVRVLYDSCYTVENKSEFTYGDAKAIYTAASLPTATTVYYSAGNEYEYIVGTSAHTLIFRGSHIAYVNRNQINNIKTLSFLDTASLLSDEVIVDTTVIEKPSRALALLNYKKALYAFGNFGFKNNILVSKTDSYEFPLTNVLDLDASQDSKVNSLVTWRDYLIAASNNAIYLINKLETGFTSKVVNTFTGVSDKDKDTLMSILNGLIFKNGEKLFALSPSVNSSTDSILSISELSKPIGDLLNIETDKITGMTTESYYGIFLTLSDKTLLLKYDYGTKNFSLMEYPIRVKQVFVDSVQNILVTDYNGKQYYFNREFPETYIDVIGYGDVLNHEYSIIGENTTVTPISFEIDSGEKSDDMGYEKNFVETRITFGLKSAKEVIPLTLDVYTDGHKQIAHKAVETDTPFWNDSLDDLTALNSGFDTNNSQIINTLKEFRIRHHGFGKTIRHVITGNSVTKFKIYVVYYKYRTLPGEE